ncbi:MAG: tetratricopeptide repeat protein [bacterium]
MLLKSIKKILITLAVSAIFTTMGFAYYDGAEFQKNSMDFAYEFFLNDNFKLSENLFNAYAAEYPEGYLAGDATFMTGESRYQSGGVKEALNSYLSVIDKYPGAKNKYKKELYYRIAECYSRLKDYKNSIKYSTLVVEYFEGTDISKDARLLLGEAYYLDKDKDKAVEVLTALEKFPEYSKRDYAYYIMGRLYYDNYMESALTAEDKKPLADSALKYYNLIKEEFPQSRLLTRAEVRKANVFYAMKEYDRAIAILQEVKTDPTDKKFSVLVKYFMAWNYFMENQYDKAVVVYDEIITDSPEDILAAWAEYKKGLCFEANGDMKAVVAQHRKVVEKYPQTIPAAYASYALALNTYNAGDPREALNGLREICALYNIEELSRASYFMQGKIYAELGEFARAVEIYEKMEGLYKPDAQLLKFLKGWNLYHSAEYQKAILIFEELINDVSTAEKIKAQSTLKIGDCYFEQKDFEKANEYYDAVIKNYPALSDMTFEAAYGKGWIAYSKNSFDEALTAFGEAKDSAYDKASRLRAVFMTANTLYASYKFNAALALYGSVMNDKNAPKNIKDDSYFYAAWCHYRSEDFDGAVKLWRQFKSMTVDTVRRAEAQYRIGWAFFRRDEYDKAVEEFKDITANYRSTHYYQEAILKIGDCYYNKNDYARAITSYNELVEKFPEHYRVPEALYGIQWAYYQMNEPEKAVEVSKQFVDQYPGSDFTPEIQYRIAEHYYNIKKYETAIEGFDNFLQKNPKQELSDNAYYWLGMSYFAVEKYNEAVAAFKNLMEKFPRTPFYDRAVFKAGNAAFKLHDYNGAITFYRMLYDKGATSEFGDDASFNIGMSYKRLDNYEEAKIWYKNLVENYPNSELSGRGMLNLAYLYQDEKNYDAAIIAFTKIAAAGKEKAAEAQFWIADCYNAKHMTATAVEEYEKVYKKYPKEEMWAVTALNEAGKIMEKQGDLKKAIALYEDILKATTNKKWTEPVKNRIVLLEEQYNLTKPTVEKSVVEKPATKTVPKKHKSAIKKAIK